MLVHFTQIKVRPESIQEAADILGGSKTLEYFLKARGLNHGSLLESVDEPGSLLSLSMWDSLADAQAVFADPNYAALLGEVRSLLIAAPTRVGHNLLTGHFSQPLPIDQPLFVHNTILSVAAENVQNLIAVLYSPKVVALMDGISGFIMSYAFESLEEPGRIVSMSWWKSAADAQSTFTRQEYIELLGDLRQYFIKAPERRAFRMLRVVRHDSKV